LRATTAHRYTVPGAWLLYITSAYRRGYCFGGRLGCHGSTLTFFKALSLKKVRGEMHPQTNDKT